MKKLQDKVALITGGSSGIGFAAAQLLAQHGAKIVIVARDDNKLKAARDMIDSDVLCLQADVSQLTDLDYVYTEVSKHYAGIDIIFANAGFGKRTVLNTVTENDFDNIVGLNYKGTFFTIQKALPYLRDKACIILNASIAGIVAYAHQSLYSSSKAAVIHLGKVFAADLVHRKIRVNSISPGLINTPLWQPLSNTNMLRSLETDVPLENRFGTLDEAAGVVLFLSSDDSGYITGQNIVLDGGLSTLWLKDRNGV